MTTTRRDRLRAETIAEIKTAALDQMVADGAPALSLRAVARAIGMSPAGLYRYYDGRDELLTDLLTDAYADLADRVEAAGATDGDPFERFAAAAHAYRSWAIEQPERFLLIFGTPIPGYAAPTDGPTVDANRRMGRALFEIGLDGWRQGLVAVPDLGRPATRAEQAMADEIGGVPPALVPTFLGLWAHLHGLVILEVTNQWHWLYPDPGILFAGEVDRMLAALSA